MWIVECPSQPWTCGSGFALSQDAASPPPAGDDPEDNRRRQEGDGDDPNAALQSGAHLAKRDEQPVGQQWTVHVPLASEPLRGGQVSAWKGGGSRKVSAPSPFFGRSPRQGAPLPGAGEVAVLRETAERNFRPTGVPKKDVRRWAPPNVNAQMGSRDAASAGAQPETASSKEQPCEK
jgi:hypothetical protein